MRLEIADTTALPAEFVGTAVLRPKDGQTPANDANVRVVPKTLESSNVNPIESMIEMLQSSRSYDMKVKMLTMARELDDQTARLMRTDR